MIEGSHPLALVYSIYYKLLKTNLNPQALLKDPKDKTLLLQASSDDIKVDVSQMIKWEDIKLPEEWELIHDMPPILMPPTQMQNIETENLKSIEQYLDGIVKIRFDHSKPRLPPLLKYNNSRHSFSGSSSTSKRDQGINEYLKQLNLNKQKDIEQKDIKQKEIKEENPQVNSVYYSVDNQHNRNIESDNESLNPTPSDMDGEIENQLNTIKKHLADKLEAKSFHMFTSVYEISVVKGKRTTYSNSEAATHECLECYKSKKF